MDFYVIDKQYIADLKTIDNRVGDIEYGATKLKFHLGIIISVNNKNYYVPVSSPKSKHLKMSDSVDFIKINHYSTGQLLCVLNLNNMIPAPSNCIQQLKRNNVETFRQFSNEAEKNNYIFLLDEEKISIKNKEAKIKKNATKLYRICCNSPESKIALRCCDFKKLEKVCEKWQTNQKDE